MTHCAVNGSVKSEVAMPQTPFTETPYLQPGRCVICEKVGHEEGCCPEMAEFGNHHFWTFVATPQTPIVFQSGKKSLGFTWAGLILLGMCALLGYLFWARV